MNECAINFKRHRFPPQIIAHAVWLYYRFPLSLRLVEEMLLERGILVSYESRSGLAMPDACTENGPRKMISGIWMKLLSPSRARSITYGEPVDQKGYVLDEIVQNRRNTKAARRLLMRLLKKQGLSPRIGAPIKPILLGNFAD